MASPHEVLEIAIPLPADSTPESRRAAALRVIQALHINEYYFVRRQTPVLTQDDGQCPTCKCELVHVTPTPAFATAEDRMAQQQRRLLKMETALLRIATILENSQDDVLRALSRDAKQAAY